MADRLTLQVRKRMDPHSKGEDPGRMQTGEKREESGQRNKFKGGAPEGQSPAHALLSFPLPASPLGHSCCPLQSSAPMGVPGPSCSCPVVRCHGPNLGGQCTQPGGRGEGAADGPLSDPHGSANGEALLRVTCPGPPPAAWSLLSKARTYPTLSPCPLAPNT